ncbi:peptidoglycan DD-metalloendopeptidase family protein [Peribacillus butanolivorans]|uniref:peptidoglycan DD-metalloendopeptidase family protein n=1 Tax=Peribacillus butanolivorans TaxID=421767 RepID=UPI0035DFEA9D
MFISKNKGIFLFMISVMLLLAGNRATAAGISEIKTIQHVYLNNEFVGSVTDEAEIEKIVADKIAEAEADYPDYTFDSETQLAFVGEEVFSDEVKVDQVLKGIDDQLKVKADAYEINIDNQVVAYVPSKEDAEEVVRRIALLYVDEEEYAEYESSKRESESDTVETLKEPGSRILNIEFSHPITFNETAVDPKKIMTVSKTLSMIEEGKEEKAIYKVKEDEELEEVANKHDMDLTQLLELNPDLNKDNGLKAGESVYVTQSTPYVNVMVEREVLKEEGIPFEKKVKKDDDLLKDELVIEQEGNDGVQAFTYTVEETNGKKISETIVKKEVTEKAITEITRKGTKVIPSNGSGTYSWPADGGYISSKQGQRWGKLHKGIDIARPTTRTITAADHGIVEFAGDSGGYGNKVIINHNNGFKTLYAHLDSIDVKAGQKVGKGMKIGMMGSTGHSTGVHLHFEVYKNGSLANPLNYISQ